MSEYAPQAIRDLFDHIHAKIPAAELSGILGDQSHTYGYHRARNVLPASDYSVGQTSRDRAGDGWAASALDVKLPADLMRVVSARLMAACRGNDPRLGALREWFGTLDGENVTGWDRLEGGYTSSDDSHLWHVHLSIFRDSATNAAALAPIVDVMAGAGSPTTPINQEDEVTPEQIKEIAAEVLAATVAKDTGSLATTVHDTRVIARRAELAALRAVSGQAALVAALGALKPGTVDLEAVSKAAEDGAKAALDGYALRLDPPAAQ